MNIRTRLTLIFFSIVIIVLTAISASIYVVSSNFRKEDFFRRLRNRAVNTAKLLVEVEEVNPDLLRRIEQNNPASLPNQYIVIYDHDGTELYRSENTERFPIDDRLLSRIRAKENVEFKYEELDVIGFLFQSKDERYAIVAAASDVYGGDALHYLRNTLIIVFLISAVFVSLMGWVFAGRVLRPISRIVSDVDNITEMNLSRRVNQGNSSDELGKLAATFNRMLHRIQSAFSSQKTFIANASHEIKTPITVMSGEIEVALLQDRDKDYYVNTLHSVLRGLKSLNSLSTQLLVLAQTDSDKPMRNVGVIRIDDILWEAKDELAKVHPEYMVEIQLPMSIGDDSLSLQADEQLLRIALVNLIDNGCKYSDDNRVEVKVRANQPTRIVLDIVNNGPGIADDMVDKIFDPFFRAHATKTIKGSGIGLSLVKRIVHMHGGSISVKSVPYQQTVFTLEFPIVTAKPSNGTASLTE
ncbi:ATP-binding protein [Chryseolinea sp. T2]|uniref:sensor histidine kinase n=1 Tax=Chryseolinea sp. T2 TaxID=3129255 RepID=UPI003077B389